ncbi:hypothetical protein O7606_16005 [Micromonospora sp. WMMD882]|uniref:hypothetical protein n=1 Tax=Micromonospora sp. WMMD882 TaxID=3015151 RepID=UPI00248ABF2A|nr:hypothetical protein [Micromonospora sp. WMMD882]WBB77774.1 hypothetical protein O7606_16005 [Micromonospora sp. WMMD882]
MEPNETPARVVPGGPAPGRPDRSALLRTWPAAGAVTTVPVLVALAAGAVTPSGWATVVALTAGTAVAVTVGRLLTGRRPTRPPTTDAGPTPGDGPTARDGLTSGDDPTADDGPAPGDGPAAEGGGDGTAVGVPVVGAPAVVRTHFDVDGGYVDCAGATVWASADGDPAGFTPGVACAVSAVVADGPGGTCRVSLAGLR